MSVREAAKLCGVGGRILRSWLREDAAPLHRGPEGDLIHWKDLRKSLQRRGVPVPGAVDSGPRIVVADDNPDQLLVIVEVLEGLWKRARVATAKDGEKALAKIADFRPDLLITDIEMPGLSGIELCRRVLQNREHYGMRILAITGYDREGRNILAFESGVDEYLKKPFSPEDLRQSAVRLLGLFPDRERAPRTQSRAP
ncbi:MAG: response regulator [Elusimicrobia bacterium]|nr:response regulator [Elusimicrobiota bacterium]